MISQKKDKSILDYPYNCVLDPDTFVCKNCGWQAGGPDWRRNCPMHAGDIRQLHNEWVKITQVPEALVPRLGVGSFMKLRTMKWGVPPCQFCDVTAKKMDDHGIPWCIENSDVLAEEILNNLKRHRGLAVKLLARFPKFAKKAAVEKLLSLSIEDALEFEDNKKSQELNKRAGTGINVSG